jgi:hypothetical protein
VTVSSTTSGSTSGGMDGGGGGGGMGGGANNGIEVLNAANGVTLQVRQVNKTMSDGNNVNFWVFCNAGGGGGGGGGGCAISGPVLQLGVGQTANSRLI